MHNTERLEHARNTTSVLALVKRWMSQRDCVRNLALEPLEEMHTTMRFHGRKHARGGERGVTMIIVVIAMLSMLAMVALAVDVIF